MFFTPNAAAPSRSACNPIMFLSRHEMWATTSMPASSCTILAAATGCILSLARAPSEMSMAWTPHSFNRRGLDDLRDGVTARQVDLDRHGEAGTQPLRELRDGFCSNLRPSGLLHHGHPAAGAFAFDPEVPQRSGERSHVGWGGPAAAAYEPRPGLGKLHAVLDEVVDVPLKADVAADELGEPGVGEGRDGTRPYGHLPDDLHHPLRTDGTVRPR